MAIHPADGKVFKIMDYSMFYIGEIVAGFIFLLPIICVVSGIIFHPREGANASVFARNIFEVISLIGSVSGVVLIWSMITMRVNPKVIFILGGFAFLYAMYTGFGLTGIIIIVLSLIALFVLDRVAVIHNFTVKALNYTVDKFEMAGFLGLHGSLDALLYESVSEGEIGNVPVKKGIDLKMAAFIGVIIACMAAILAWEVYVILFIRYIH